MGDIVASFSEGLVNVEEEDDEFIIIHDDEEVGSFNKSLDKPLIRAEWFAIGYAEAVKDSKDSSE